RKRSIQDVDDTIHRVVDQALDFVIARQGELHGEVWIALHHWRRRHTSRSIECCRPKRESRAADWEWWKDLADHQQRQSMDLIRVERPGDAVARMDPHFIGKKGQRLPTHVGGLGAHLGMPILLGVKVVRKTHNY